MKVNKGFTAIVLGWLVMMGLASCRMSPQTKERPNIVLILGDDMGFSDLGCYGSSISTPNLDSLAYGGLRYTQFYNGARCCPSRACLMTGLYPHQAGLGWMTTSRYDLPGYRDELNDSCVTIAEVLRASGYHTYMAGKWHLCHDIGPEGPKYDWPLQRGFEKFYGILKGASSYYDPVTLCRGNRQLSPFTDSAYRPENYYLTNAITDNSVRFLRQREKDKPFFMYVAYTAAHWPMQAPDADIEKYKGKYDNGWEAVREARLEKMERLGILSKQTELSPLDTHPWAEEKEQAAMERRMETYAAMITIMDRGIGEIVSELKRQKIYDNTVILFLQDNGACEEPIFSDGPTHPVAADTAGLKPLGLADLQTSARPLLTRDGKVVMTGRAVLAGPADTYVTYLRPWANVSNTPFRLYKHWVHEGGISTPLIVHWPAGVTHPGELRTQVCHEIDIMPTITELAGAHYPGVYKGHQITPEAGESLVGTFANKPLPPRTLFWEHEMNRAVRMGKWKLVSVGGLIDKDKVTRRWQHYRVNPWELYDMEADRTELHDLSEKKPELVKKMAAMWELWAHRVGVFPAPWTPVWVPGS